MKALKASYLNELYKLSKKKKITVCAVLIVAATVLGGIITSLFGNFMGISIMGRSAFVTVVLSVMNQTLIPLFTIFVCADMFAGEFSDRTMKQTLTRPASRGKVYLAKLLAAATFILGCLALTFVAAGLLSFFLQTAAFSFLKVLLAYLVSAVPLFVFALLVSMLANIMKSSAATFLVSVILFLLLSGLGLYFSSYQSFFFTAFFNWYNLFMGSYVNVSRIIRLFLIFAGSGTMFYGAGYYLFERKEL